MRFHAAAPRGEWINDPNGLAFVDGRYRLFVQHRADAPDFTVTGWARLSSDDLLHWEWDGVVLPADAAGYAYSGSTGVGRDGALLAWHTRHRPDAAVRERQYCASSRDGGVSWQHVAGPVGPAGHDARDPFVFRHAGACHMLLARPCSWDDPTGMSALQLVRQQRDGSWGAATTVDVPIPAGVLCEVPSLIRRGNIWLLLASFVDRRGPATTSWSGYWPGRFAAGQFMATTPSPIRIDHGPDFYAPIANLAAGWPAPSMLIGWASGWATARHLQLAGGGHGGALSLPRRFALAGGRLNVLPPAAAAGLARMLAWQSQGCLRITSGSAQAMIRLAPGRITITRQGSADSAWNWARDSRDSRIGRRAALFFDAGLVELFIGGAAATLMVPGDNHRLEWTHDD